MALLLTPLSVTSQTPPIGSDQQPAFRFGLSVDMVHLGVTVVKKNRLVTNLVESDFHVYEDGVLQEISFFSRGTDSPVDVFLLVDASGSMDMERKVANARTAAMQLIHSLDPVDRVAVYGFDKDVFELCPFTEDRQKAIAALEGVEAFGVTAIHDAVAKASALVEGQGFGRRAIVVITDGIDTASQLSVAQAVDAAKRVDLPVYAVRVLSPLDDPKHDAYLGKSALPRPAEDALQRFAEETGGRLFEGSQLGVLRQISTQIREELKTQYRLGYVPRNSAHDGRFRRIEVRTKKGAEVRTRKGYYAKRGKSSSRVGDTASSSH
jgi:Ca-activated chloride channel family protein